MQWRIDGAEKSTGTDRTVVLEANNGLEAQTMAEGMSMLVSSCRKATAKDVAEFASPRFTEDDTSDRATSRPQAPEYPEISRGARMLMGFARFLEVVAAIMAFGSIFAVVGGVATGSGSAVVSGIVGLLSAATCFGVALVYRMVASLSLAVRDMARNSFSEGSTIPGRKLEG